MPRASVELQAQRGVWGVGLNLCLPEGNEQVPTSQSPPLHAWTLFETMARLAHAR